MHGHHASVFKHRNQWISRLPHKDILVGYSVYNLLVRTHTQSIRKTINLKIRFALLSLIYSSALSNSSEVIPGLISLANIPRVFETSSELS